MNSVYSNLKWFFFAVFENCHFRNVVSTLTNVVKLDVEKDNLVSPLSNVVHINVEMHIDDLTLFDIVNSNVEIHNVASALIRRCPTLRRRIDQKTPWSNAEMFAGIAVRSYKKCLALLVTKTVSYFILMLPVFWSYQGL